MSEKMAPWREKISDLISTCQGELKKTTAIGKRMISASKTNTQLKEAYEELGQLVVSAIDSKELDWQNPKVESLVKDVQKFQKDLEKIEEDVQNLKRETVYSQNSTQKDPESK